MMVLFHHCVPLDFVQDVDVLVPSKEMSVRHLEWWNKNKKPDDYEYHDATGPNLWLQERTGFYPLFMALDDVEMCGYDANWRTSLSSTWKNGRTVTLERRHAGEYPNVVLFSFDDVRSPVFLDYQYWFFVLNRSYGKHGNVTPYEERLIFKPKRTKAQWLRGSKNGVMVVVPSLDLRTCCRVWVRNEATRKLLSKRFENVQVKRIPVC